MTTPVNDFPMPYEVEFYHDAEVSTSNMVIKESQRGTSGGASVHVMDEGVYMISLSYNRAQSIVLRHLRANTNFYDHWILPEVSGSVNRSTPPVKISVNQNERFLIVAPADTPGSTSGRAILSVIPFETYKPT